MLFTATGCKAWQMPSGQGTLRRPSWNVIEEPLRKVGTVKPRSVQTFGPVLGSARGGLYFHDTRGHSSHHHGPSSMLASLRHAVASRSRGVVRTQSCHATVASAEARTSPHLLRCRSGRLPFSGRRWSRSSRAGRGANQRRPSHATAAMEPDSTAEESTRHPRGPIKEGGSWMRCALQPAVPAAKTGNCAWAFLDSAPKRRLGGGEFHDPQAKGRSRGGLGGGPGHDACRDVNIHVH